MSDSDKTEHVAALRHALQAMNGWAPTRRLEYNALIGLTARTSEFTRDFEGDAEPEPDAVTRLAPDPLTRLLYLLARTDEICLDAPTARSITGTPKIPGLVHLIREAQRQGLVERPGHTPELVDTDRYRLAALQLTEAGRERARSVRANGSGH